MAQQQNPQPVDPSINLIRQKPWRARWVERRTAGSARGPGKRTGSNPGTALRAYSAFLARHAGRGLGGMSAVCDSAGRCVSTQERDQDGAKTVAGAGRRGGHVDPRRRSVGWRRPARTNC